MKAPKISMTQARCFLIPGIALLSNSHSWLIAESEITASLLLGIRGKNNLFSPVK